MSHQKERGFTLIEILLVVLIGSILISAAVWSGGGIRGQQLRALGQDYEKTLTIMDRARFGALTGAVSWIVDFDCTNNVVRFGPDDGWKGSYNPPPTPDPNSATPQYTSDAKPREYYPGSPDFWDGPSGHREDGILDDTANPNQPVREEVSRITLDGMLEILEYDSIGATYTCPATPLIFQTNGSSSSSSIRIFWIAVKGFSPASEVDVNKEMYKPFIVLPSGIVHLPHNS